MRCAHYTFLSLYFLEAERDLGVTEVLQGGQVAHGITTGPGVDENAQLRIEIQ
jgi:hypothetical protein